MASSVLHFDFFSQPSRACYIFVKQADLPVEFAPLRLNKQEHRTPEFTAMSGGFTQVCAANLPPVKESSGTDLGSHPAHSSRRFRPSRSVAGDVQLAP